MRQTKLFTRTLKEYPKDEVSKNAQLLIRAGFIDKTASGIYNFLPLGLRVLNKINAIIREEMDGVGGQEIFLSALQSKEIWEKTGRWDNKIVDNWFKTKLKNDTELGLAFTHEEAITSIMKNYITSYKNLPFSVYQIQTKFRNETRAKSGLIRGREFLMKDMYSFSKNKEEHDIFYEKMKGAYMKVFGRLGMGDDTYLTISSGGSFSKYSYEFQTLSEAGEDSIYLDKNKKIAINKEDFNEEILKDLNLDLDKNNLIEKRSVEVGDIYSLEYKYSEAFDLKFADENGKNQFVYMGSYGMSPSRLMGTLVELNNDEKGIIWPKEVSPFDVHLISLRPDQNEKETAEVYEKLEELGIDILLDDRLKISAGQKFAESDLMGISTQIILSPKTLENNSVEIKDRRTGETHILSIDNLSELT